MLKLRAAASALFLYFPGRPDSMTPSTDNPLTAEDHLSELSRRLADASPGLSPQLRQAAAYVLDHPGEVAFQSVRGSASAAGVTPSTLVRLAKKLGFGSYEPFRQVFQAALQEGSSELSGRATRLKQHSRTRANSVFGDIGDSALANVAALLTADNQTRVEAAAQRLLDARRIAAIGFRDTFTCAYHFAYVGRIAMPHIELIRGLEGGLLTELAPLGEGDLAVVFGFAPYCAETLRALEVVRRSGAGLIVVTDTLSSPLVPGADLVFNLASDTPHFFPSILAAITLIEAMLAECVARGPAELVDNVTRFEQRMRELGAYVE
ncbi:MurR/RpiR family transcriptional regulator [Halomonas piscis]|uniref:MurR/RpiR family transcriptional regulator n=1 Tax=Halomonas piscis TaxID=3031727 RepID=A0ABY9YVC3_9GAMM|nr:MurR/RpiR family transcriptional regulator [Halomonas piscis]WNK18766.1 MurR/RpiR family transcriptional regulator [Halomonas piscis]